MTVTCRCSVVKDIHLNSKYVTNAHGLAVTCGLQMEIFYALRRISLLELNRVASEQLLGNELVVVRFLEQLHNIVSRFALLEEPAKCFIAQLTRNVFQCTKVITGAIGR